MSTFKFHWGYGIALFFTVFVVFILTAVFTSTKENIHLVTEDYYAEELAYQKRIDQISNTNSLNGKVDIKALENHFEIAFPGNTEEISGEINFFRPSNSALDQSFAINLDTNGKQLIATNNLVKGYYRIKVTWSMQGRDFYKEEPIYLP